MNHHRALQWVRRALGEAWHVARGIAGETAYEQYLEHRRRYHPGEAVLGEREFWRQHIDRGDTDPGARCC